MEFGLEKCNKVTIKKGRPVIGGESRVEDVTIKELDGEGLYKFLGVEENAQIEHQKMRQKIRSEFFSAIKENTKN